MVTSPGIDADADPDAGTDGGPAAPPTRLSSISGLSGRLREDLGWAWRFHLLCSIGGSMWTPRVMRRLIYSIAGASIQSAPGVGFIYAGSPRNLTVGRGVYMNRGVYIEAIAPVSVGHECALGMEAMILTSHHPIDRFGRWRKTAIGQPVAIGDRVWIGARALILPGVTIESDVVIAAAAVVTGHCRSHGIYAGVPARRIREFTERPPT